MQIEYINAINPSYYYFFQSLVGTHHQAVANQVVASEDSEEEDVEEVPVKEVRMIFKIYFNENLTRLHTIFLVLTCHHDAIYHSCFYLFTRSSSNTMTAVLPAIPKPVLT